MPALNEVSCLEIIIGNFIRKWLLKVSTNAKSNNDAKQMNNYIKKHLNANIRQKIIIDIMDLHIYTLDVNHKCLLLELLGDISTNSVDMSQSGSIYIEEVFHLYRILSMSGFKNLSKLGIHCNVKSRIDLKYVQEVNNIIYKSLNQMKNLRWVTLYGLGEALLLQILGNSCPFLEYLDVRDSLLLNDTCILSLLYKNLEEISSLTLDDAVKYMGPKNECCSCISYLGISGTDIGFGGILLTLINCPNLCSYGGYLDQVSICVVISYLESKLSLEVPLKISELWSDNISVKQVLTLDVLCPFLSSLTTDVPSLDSLLRMKNFSITNLDIDCDFKSIAYELMNFLSRKASYITSLSLKKSINTVVDIETLISHTPFLKEIQIQLQLIGDESIDDTEQWSSLIKADVSVDSLKCLKIFLKHSPKLTYFKLKFIPEEYSEKVDDLNDEFITDMLSKGVLKHLEYFSLEDCGLGTNGLDAILLNCDKLKYLEKLFFWKCIQKSDLSKLKKKIQSSNWNLKVVLKEKYSDMDW